MNVSTPALPYGVQVVAKRHRRARSDAKLDRVQSSPEVLSTTAHPCTSTLPGLFITGR